MKKIISIFLILAIFFPSAALADDASLEGGAGETVYPVSSTYVGMQKEVIDINVKDGKSYVTCQFYFKNAAKYADLLMGFPSFYDSGKLPGDPVYYSKKDIRELGDIKLYDFRTYVNDHGIRVIKKTGMQKTAYNKGEDYYPVWYTWSLQFRPNQIRKVTNTYWCYNTITSGDPEEVRYILKTGAYWKGVISDAILRMDIDETNPCLIGFADDCLIPDYYTEDGILVWDKKNIEPDKDINVRFKHLNLEWYTDYLIWDELETEESVNFWGLESMISLCRLENHFKQEHYRSVIWWGKRIRRVYKSEKQPEILNYYIGVAYYNRHLYKNALKELRQCGVLGLSYKALCLKKLGRKADYIACLNEMAVMNSYPGLVLWAKSRLKDLNV